MVPLMGPPARIFFSSSSLLHSSSVGRMNSSKKTANSSAVHGTTLRHDFHVNQILHVFVLPSEMGFFFFLSIG